MRIPVLKLKTFTRFLFLLAGVALLFSCGTQAPSTRAKNTSDLIESAMFTKQEFFGVDAIAPLPTAEVRENLVHIAVTMPDDIKILENLAEADEKLTDFDAVEKTLNHIVEIDPNKSEKLVAFYDRRARFDDEAKQLCKILANARPNDKPGIFERIINLARRHDLKEYLQPGFYGQVASENADIFPIFENFIKQLTDDENYVEALKFVRQAKAQFPDKKQELLEKEISLLSDLDKNTEAEKLYISSFDPFWTDDESERFYSFLSDHERLREYAAEIKTKFDRNNADFDAAVRLADYRNHQSDTIAPVILKLEKAKSSWTTDELLTITRLLLRNNEGDIASRYLYTLCNRGDLKEKGELRAKVLYQLFEVFSDAGDQRLPLTNGDLQFYKEAATIDTNPGIATGILSLIFSDSDPGAKFEQKETEANAYFNRAAAYRIFLAYKAEFPTTPELAQMYLDIIKLYTSTEENEIAEKTLNEFAQRYENSTDFPQVALKLAEAFTAHKETEKSREVYREIINYLGDNNPSATSDSDTTASTSSETSAPPSSSYNTSTDYFHDHLGSKQKRVTYRDVLERLVDSLASDKKVPEILKLFSGEIKKHPDAEWLYEWRLSWLEQTNLTEEQLAAYREALSRFQSSSWSDKLARWFLRQKRQTDFEAFSTDLVERVSDSEVQDYLSEFIDSKASTTEFEKQLYLKLYLTALNRFPHDSVFVEGLLRFYKANKRETEWRNLAAKYYFESNDVRKLFLDDLSEKGELRAFLASAKSDNEVYKLFRADASIRLSNFEQAVNAYRELNSIYPNKPELIEELVHLTRSLGQKDSQLLSEAARVAHAQADFSPSEADLRERSGEIYAELGNYDKSRDEWDKIPSSQTGDLDVYLQTATVYWDYFQYRDALRTINAMREKFADETLCAFEAGAIHEALHNDKDAIGEYVKALDTADDETESEKARRRLTILSRKGGMVDQISSAYAIERSRRKDSSFLTLGYARFLNEIKKQNEAEQLLDKQVATSRDSNFLEAVRHFYSDEGIESGEQTTLKRLADTTESPRRSIKYRLQLAESLEESRDSAAAKATLDAMVQKFPNNYGVLISAADMYHQLGFEDQGISLLQNALALSRGAYQNKIAGKLSQRLIQLDRLEAAEQILAKLHDENKADLDLFKDLATIYVRENKPELLRKVFDETVNALKKSDAERREIDEEIANYRGQMIDAFTRLKDYRSAIEQHIEIINRDPDDEELTDNAIEYVKRYGGADTLLAYYQKTSTEAYKNYRWNVVLARIYEAQGDLETAIRNYRAAIVNQPEMAELYVSTADLETRQNNFDAALKDLDTVLELTNDAPEYTKKKIEVLTKAGRKAEAEAEKAKLPTENKPTIGIDRFAEAERLQSAQNKDEALKAYREAFDALVQNPLEGELTAAGIAGYVNSVREEESLQQISERLWNLRKKLIVLSDEADSTKAGDARRRLSTLDVAIVESVGNILKTIATDDELAAVHSDLLSRIDEVSVSSDPHQTFALIQNISDRAGFGDLEEKILFKKLDAAEADSKGSCVRDIVNFYDERGAYERAFAVLVNYGSNDLPLKAGYARLAGQHDKELDFLRQIYAQPADKLVTEPDANVKRYLELLYAGRKDELASLTEKTSHYQLQLINFLLAKGERSLAHTAIENSNKPLAWELARNAETSLALGEYSTDSRCYFCDALQFASIGEMIEQQSDKQRFLVGDDWFRLTREFGEWMYRSPHKTGHPSLYLTALTENRPHSPAEQTELGAFYMNQKNFDAAVRHFRIAVEENPNDTGAKTDLGAAYYLAGKQDWAKQMFDRAIAETQPADDFVFLRSLQRFGLENVARIYLVPKIVEFLKTNNADTSPDFQNLIRSIAASFKDENQRATYFQDILKQRSTDTSLAKMLVDESLVNKTRADSFFERVISMSRELNSYDYDYNFKSVVQKTWAGDDAESVYDQENEYKVEEPDRDRVAWQKKYLDVLLERHDNRRASYLIGQIEKELSGKYARPAWLRIAKLRLQLRNGSFDTEEAKWFVGIRVADSIAEVKPPNIERFNDVIKMLKEEKADQASMKLSESYFARNLALGQFDSVNFDGLARALFNNGVNDTAIRVLQLMVNVSTPETSDAAMAEVNRLEIVKENAADMVKLGDLQPAGINLRTQALDLAARAASEFGKVEVAIAFRRTLQETDPTDSKNKTALAELLAKGGDKSGSLALLTEIINDVNESRSARWQAKWQIQELTGNVDVSNIAFDPFSQYYCGLSSLKSGQPALAASLFVNSLIDENGTTKTAQQELIRLYAQNGRSFAALKLAETDKSDKPNDLLRLLSEAAENIGDFAKAMEFERQRSDGGDAERLEKLKQVSESANQKATDLIVDLANTRKL